MILKDLKKISISEILVIVLLIIILLQRCGGGHVVDPVVPKIIRDTVWIHKDSTINSKPQVIKTIPYTVDVNHWTKEYLPDTNYAKLLKQYEALVRELLSKNVHIDSIKIDSIGHVYITDTVSRNLILSRSTHYDLHYPTITTTIIVPEPKKVHYFGGIYIQGEQGNLIDNIGLKLLILNKKNKMFGGQIGIDSDNKLQIGVSTYWRIR